VFVTGSSFRLGTGFDLTTVAYDADTGGELWVRRYDGPAHRDDPATALAVSDDGSRLFVTGWSTGVGTGPDVATVAYDTASGAQLWVTRYNGPESANDYGSSIAVSPDGSRVFVTGDTLDSSGLEDYLTLAYDAATGSQRWVSRYAGPGHGTDTARSIAVSPDGSKVFVTGESNGGSPTYFDYATVAYDSTTGWTLWLKRYATLGDDAGYSVAVSPDNSRVFVTGPSSGDYATVAYAA